VPLGTVTILGSSLAFFLVFRNNGAYDRWWEARKVWGGIVNYSRTFANYAVTFANGENKEEWSKTLVLRHLAYINALRIQLREESDWESLKPYLRADDYESILHAANKASMLQVLQGKQIQKAKKNGRIDQFEHQMLMGCIEENYNLQGMAERIKKTVFPHMYDYFTRVFLWVFILLLPCSLVESMNWHEVPITALIAFAFFILERTGLVTEKPFDDKETGTPMNALCRIIEIDLRQFINDKTELHPFEPLVNKDGTTYID
jgi:putative membrane protein